MDSYRLALTPIGWLGLLLAGMEYYRLAWTAKGWGRLRFYSASALLYFFSVLF